MSSICASCDKPATNKCSGCSSVYYCNRECQKKNWSIHKKICNRVVTQKLCNNCARPAIYCCNNCNNNYYCSEKCQADYFEVHKVICKTEHVPQLQHIETGKISNPQTRKEEIVKDIPKPKDDNDILITEFNFGENKYLPLFNLETPLECCVCLENIYTEYELCSLSCGHKFHDKCMEKYKDFSEKYSCPLCRTELIKPDVGYATAINKLISKKSSFTYYNPNETKATYEIEMDSNLTPSKLIEIKKDLLNSAKQGHSPSINNLANVYEKLGNQIMSYKWDFIGAYKNFHESQYCVSTYFYEKKDYDGFIYWQKKAADNGNIKAIHNLAKCHLRNIHVEENEIEAFKYYKKMADHNEPMFQYVMYDILRKRNNMKFAMKYLKMSYNNDYPYAQLEVGRYYLCGIEYKKNYKLGYSLIKKVINSYENISRAYITNALIELFDNKNIVKALENCYKALECKNDDIHYRDPTKIIEFINTVKDNSDILKYFTSLDYREIVIKNDDIEMFKTKYPNESSKIFNN